jgi:hypothetical protein
MEDRSKRADDRSMDRRVLWMSVGLGSTVGGFVPMLFGQSSFSAASLLGSVVGCFAGIWLAARVSA